MWMFVQHGRGSFEVQYLKRDLRVLSAPSQNEVTGGKNFEVSRSRAVTRLSVSYTKAINRIRFVRNTCLFFLR
jgi:hypothetical protein